MNPVVFSNTALRDDRDEGLRKHFLRVYSYMVAGLATTGAVAWYIASSEALLQIVMQYQLVIGLGLIAMVFGFSALAGRMSFAMMQGFFFGYAALMGSTVAIYFAIFTPMSLLKTFLMASSLFLGVTLYGYTTKKDLSGWSGMLSAGMIAIVIASLLNAFIFKSSMASMAMDAIVIALSAGITAWSTQAIRTQYYEQDGDLIADKLSILGALTLYINFLNMFLSLLRLFGDRR
jgi:uncharacterized protein